MATEQMPDQNDERSSKKINKIRIALLIVLALAMVGAWMRDNERESPSRQSPDGSGWYKDSGLTNAQVIEISEFCRDNPDSWKCQ